MKKLCASLALLLLLTACSGPVQTPAASPGPPVTATPETAEAAATPQPTEEPTVSLHWIGRQNEEGLYQREPFYDTESYLYGNGGIGARYVDFSRATEEIIGKPLELENANLQLFADGESLYWVWSGMIRDTAILLRSDLDGGNRESLYDFPQGVSLGVGDEGLASDGTALYFRYCHISKDPKVPDAYELVRLDPNAETMETLTIWNEFAGKLQGVWRDKLLVTRTTLSEDCPVEPVYDRYRVSNTEELTPWLKTSLCAIDPATGQEEVLYSCSGRWLDRRLYRDTLWEVDEAHQLVCRPLGETEDTILTELPESLYLWDVYTEDVLLHGQEDGKEWLYLYNLADGTLARSPQRRWFGGEDRAIPVVSEAGPGRYLVIDDANTGMQQLADGEGTQYLIDGYTQYAIASREAMLDTTVPMTPVTRPGAP